MASTTTLTIDIPVEFALDGNRMTLSTGTPTARPREEGITSTPTKGETTVRDTYDDAAVVELSATSVRRVYLTLHECDSVAGHSYTPAQARNLAAVLVSYASAAEEAGT